MPHLNTSRAGANESSDGESNGSSEIWTTHEKNSSALARRRRKLLQAFSGLDDDGLPLGSGDLSFLERLSVKDGTREQYALEMKRFEQKMKIDVRRSTDVQVDAALLKYIHYLFFKGHPAHRVERFMAAFLHFRPEFGKLGGRRCPHFFRALKGYKRRSPGFSRKPRSFIEICGIVNQLVLMNCLRVSIYVLVCFALYLRPSEGLHLKGRDLVPPAPGVSRYWCMVLNCEEDQRTSKTGVSDESLIWDSQHLLWVVPLLQALKATTEDNEYLFPFSYQFMRRALATASQELGLPKLLPYQLRHSGPSWDRLQNYREMSEIQKRGRWISRASLVRYEKGGMVTKEFNKIALATRQHLQKCHDGLEKVLVQGAPPLVFRT